MESMLVTRPGTLLHKNGKHLVPQTVRFFLRCAIMLTDKEEALQAKDEDKAEDAVIKLKEDQP